MGLAGADGGQRLEETKQLLCFNDLCFFVLRSRIANILLLSAGNLLSRKGEKNNFSAKSQTDGAKKRQLNIVKKKSVCCFASVFCRKYLNIWK